jgi:hypothetical protein
MEAHAACKPGYSGGGEWEDHGSRPAGQNVHVTTSQPMAECGGVQLSFQIHKRLKLGGLQFQANLGKNVHEPPI